MNWLVRRDGRWVQESLWEEEYEFEEYVGVSVQFGELPPVKTLATMTPEERAEMYRLYGPPSREAEVRCDAADRKSKVENVLRISKKKKVNL